MTDKQEAMNQVTAWMKEQIAHVWCAIAGNTVLEPDGRQVQTRREGRMVLYGFWYRGTCLAEARSYFSHHEKQWKFELTWVEPGYYPKVNAYYNGGYGH